MSYKVFWAQNIIYMQYQAATAVPELDLCVFLVKYGDFWGNMVVFGVKKGANRRIFLKLCSSANIHYGLRKFLRFFADKSGIFCRSQAGTACRYYSASVTILMVR